MDSDEEQIVVAAASCIIFSSVLLLRNKKKERKRRRWWMLSLNRSRSSMAQMVYEQQLVCRACLKIVQHTAHSFGYVEDATGNLRDMLMCCVPEMDIYISLNPIICLPCIQGLIHVHNFKSRCINTESIIRTFMQKYNMSDQNPINLGSVVRDLIELNNFHKQQQEERRRQLFIEQQNSVQDPNRPPPLHFLEDGGQSPSNLPVPVQEIQQKTSESSMRPPPQLRFIPQHPLGSAPSLQSLPPLRPVPPMQNVPSLSAMLNHPPQLRHPMGHIPPVKFALPSESTPSRLLNGFQDYEVSTTQFLPGSNENVNSSTSQNEEIGDVSSTVPSDPEYPVEDSNMGTIKKPRVHPIESKLRLVVRIPRSNFSLSDIRNAGPFPENNDSSDSTETPNDDSEMMPDVDEMLMPEEMDNFDSEMQMQEDSMNPFYEIENEGIPNKHITKIFNCPCMYLTTSSALFEEHKKKCKTAKIGPKNVVRCPHCPHVTNRTYALNKHINTMHTKAVWFVCEHCTYRSTDKSCLRRHVRKTHEPNGDFDTPRQFPCNVCDMVISSEYNFNRHMLKHEDTIITTYNCEFCSYTSKDRSNYRKHVFTHSTKQLKCPSCSYSNVSPYQLKSHIKRSHDGVGIEVADCKSDIPVFQIVEEIRALVHNRDQLTIDNVDNEIDTEFQSVSS